MSRDLTVGEMPDMPWVTQRMHTSEQMHDLRLTRRFSRALDDLAPLMCQFGSNYGRFFATPKVRAYAAGDTIAWNVVEDSAGWYDPLLGVTISPGSYGSFLVAARLVSGVNNQPVALTVVRLGYSSIGHASEPSNGSGVDHAAADATSIRRLGVADLLALSVTTGNDFTPSADFGSYFAVTQLSYQDW